jgi:FkbM family methyltransferase
MCRNVKRNGFRNVETVRAAVLDRTGEVTLHVPDVVPVPSSASVKGGFWPVTRPVVAACTSLDAFLSGRGDPAVSFVKIDVEGAALEALSGMRTTLARWQPMILCEVLPQDSRPELDALLSACGYRAYCVTERGVQPVDAFATWRFAPWESNFLLLPPGREWPPGAPPEARGTESPSPLDSVPPPSLKSPPGGRGMSSHTTPNT